MLLISSFYFIHGYPNSTAPKWVILEFVKFPWQDSALNAEMILMQKICIDYCKIIIIIQSVGISIIYILIFSFLSFRGSDFHDNIFYTIVI